MSDTTLERGRDAFARGIWSDAYREFSAAHREVPLDPSDLERLATAARLVGNESESADLMARTHQELLARGDAPRAARVAIWIAMRLLVDGKTAPSAGWVARARRLLDDHGAECVEQGYVLLPGALRAAFEGNSETSYQAFSEAGSIGERYHDPELTALGRLGQGRALTRLGQIARGMALLDEVMVAVTAGEISPIIVGDLYCTLLDACQETFDLRRAHEWTASLERWCKEADMPYRGLCMIHRAELLQLHGEWPDAAGQASRACERMSRPPAHPAAGAAYYQCAELHRLRGELSEAEECYRQASRWGSDPHPGLALLRLAQGRIDAAAAAIRGVLDETRDLRKRAPALAASVEILLAVGDLGTARESAEELTRIAEKIDAPLLHARAADAEGAVLLAEGRPRAALTSLRQAATAWRTLDAPYEAARVRQFIGLAHRALGDDDTAALELDAAAHALAKLGAAADPGHGKTPSETTKGTGPRLTAREIQVLRLVATGQTNRAIADALGISEKTVARHLSNMFTKLGLTTRAAATAYAYQHRLLPLST
ncbi:MAG TPA: LuxR C-terminal-related transcriptional regulator [Gemmatimonadales bacterium]